ncbi:hypothetical protein BO82DRAFT_424726 [Aspergillus uvarum CBS 121591]|uniref:Sensor histidine kinase/response regulator n=1 Tax=Aspergillus uvarum CBS 121591 TaxID=1448315 RepID=A0A319CEH3_9EURO|nr:hypothetical protein BO82DRAFT_424726 [Aspergillus uvarum CBS 121591]PYH76983.1 hypothetical protein BO82DRAFT_424726 [Aspergillus uvarum CBS 121591]
MARPHDTPGLIEHAVRDSILTALTQLAAFRLGYGRTFTALATGDTSIVVAEATTSCATSEEGELNTASLVGVLAPSLERGQGGDTKAPSWTRQHVILDIGEDDVSLESHPLVQRSQARFYADVPVCDLSGIQIGTFGVVSRSPRSSFPDNALAVLHQTSRTIAEHLHTILARNERLRAKKQLQALTSLATERNGFPDTASVYAEACTLLQASMNLDGVILIDASRLHSQSDSTRSSCTSFCHMGGQSDCAHPRRRSSSKLCGLLGSAISEEYSTKFLGGEPPTLDEDLIGNLLLMFPHGQIFNASQSMDTRNTVHQTVARELFRAVPNAASLMFVPLQNDDMSQGPAATIVWDCDRQLGDDDLGYLKVLGDIITCWVARIEGSSLKKCKSDFLSSISHELRSPLHGMLGNCELLQSTDLSPTQMDMVTMVETCAKTLLDTLHCLLDFNKISTLTQTQKRCSNMAADLWGMATDFDLSSLVEDVTNVVLAGHRHLNETFKNSGCTGPVQDGVNSVEVDPGRKSEDLVVVVRAENQIDWRIHSISGAWSRIIKNIFGNALKFTNSGVIEIALDRNQQKRHGRTTDFAHLRITDSGCGIAQDYLENNLFTPFSQGSILTEGVGLGMSITERLVKHFGGYTKVESHLGVGTQVDVYIPVEFVQEKSVATQPPDPKVRPEKPLRVVMVGMNPDSKGDEMGQGLSTDAKRRLAIVTSISSLLSRHAHHQLSFAEPSNCGGGGGGDIAIIEEPTWKATPGIDLRKSRFRSVIVIGGFGLAAPRHLVVDGVDVFHIPQPLGPKGFLRTLREITDLQSSTSAGEYRLAARPISVVPARPRSSVEDSDKAESSKSPPAVKTRTPNYARSLPQAPAEGAICVLVVDDNEINLKVLSMFLKKIGCTFETASDGSVASDKYKQATRKFDYVLMALTCPDLCMPRMDGIAATSEIRRYEEEHGLSRTAILALTGVASSEMQDQAFAAGIDDYLLKPLSLNGLKHILGVS